MAYVLDFARLMEAVRGLGVEPPKGVTAVFETVDALRQATKSEVGNVDEGIKKTIRQAAARGRPLTVDEAHDFYQRMTPPPLPPGLGQALQNLETPTSKLIQELLREDAGDELMANLHPVVDHAIKGIQRAGEFYSADTTAEQLIDLGPEAVEAWRAAGEHAAVLDQVMNTVIRPMTLLELIDPQLIRDAGPYQVAVWIINPDKGYLTADVGVELTKPTYAFSVPGGRWIKINQMAGLHLNSPRQAETILRGIAEAQAEADAARYQIRPAKRASVF